MGPSKICPFCCKNSRAEDDTKNKNAQEEQIRLFLSNFCKVLERKLGFKNAHLTIIPISQHELLSCCNVCFTIIENICNLYHEIKCLELQLEWKIESLKNIVKLSDKVKSRQQDLQSLAVAASHLQNQFHEPLLPEPEQDKRQSIYQSVKEFRKEFQKSCTKHVYETFPRVIFSKTVPGTIDADDHQVKNKPEASFLIQSPLMLTQQESLQDNLPKVETTDNEKNNEQQDLVNCTENDDDISSPSSMESETGDERDLEIASSSEPLLEANLRQRSSGLENEMVETVTNHNITSLVTNKKCLSLQNFEEDTHVCSNNLNAGHNTNNFTDNDGASEPKKSEILVNVKQEQRLVNREDFSMECDTPSNNTKYNLRTLKSTHEDKDHDDDAESYKMSVSSSDSSSVTSTSSYEDIHDKPCLRPEKRDNNLVFKPDKSKQCPFCHKMFSRYLRHLKKCKKRTKSEYFCRQPPCNEYFQSEEEQEHHAHLHGSFSCSLCDFTETFAPNFSLHVETHSERKEKVEGCYYCPKCPYRIQGRRNNYIQHYLEKHLNISASKAMEKRKCTICNAFVVKPLIDKHILTNHGEGGPEAPGVVKCDVKGCTAYFLNKSQLQIHRRNAHFPPLNHEKDSTVKTSQKSRYVCPWCKKSFNMFSLLEIHKKSHLVKLGTISQVKQKRGVLCGIANCRKRFVTKDMLKTHKKLHGEFQCGFCQDITYYALDLALHELKHNNRNKICSLNGKNKVETGCKINCPRCTFVTKRQRSYLIHHVETHMSLCMRPYVCEVCCDKFINKTHKDQHVSTYHNIEMLEEKDIYRCDQCSAYFIRGGQLIAHKRKLHSYSFKCSFCEGVYKSSRSLKLHVRCKHANDDNSHLPVCDEANCRKRFTTKEELELHLSRVHCEILGYRSISSISCTVCNKVCKGEFALKSHMQVHTPNKNRKARPRTELVCEHCGKKDKSKETHENHVLYHQDPSTWPFKCPTCSKTCVNKYKLQEHMQVHSKDKPFVCEMCGEKYAHRHNYRYHMKNKHGIVVPIKIRKKK